MPGSLGKKTKLKCIGIIHRRISGEIPGVFTYVILEENFQKHPWKIFEKNT